jgi:hypothetical protein
LSTPTVSKTPVGNVYVPADEYILDNHVYWDGEWRDPIEGKLNLACLRDDYEIQNTEAELTQVEGPLIKITTSRGLVATVGASSSLVGRGGKVNVCDISIGDQIATAAKVPSIEEKDSAIMDDNLVKLLSYCTVYGYWEHNRMVVNIPAMYIKARKEFISLIDYYHDFSLGEKKFDEFYFVRGLGESPIANLCKEWNIDQPLPEFVWWLNDRHLHMFLSIYYNTATEYIVDGYKVFIEKRIDADLIWPMQLLLAKIGIVARRGRTVRHKHRLLVLNKRDVGYIAQVLQPLDKTEVFAAAYAKTKGRSVWRREGDVWWDIVKTVDGAGSGWYLDSNGEFIVNNLVIATSV